jgi:hypothetical protein
MAGPTLVVLTVALLCAAHSGTVQADGNCSAVFLMNVSMQSHDLHPVTKRHANNASGQSVLSCSLHQIATNHGGTPCNH